MEREFYQELIKWKNTKTKKPLIVIGAREVGKTYIVKKFCEDNYDNVLYIDLVNDQTLKEIFKSNDTFDEKCDRLSNYLQADLTDKDTILFVDEVQESLDFIDALTLFYESENNYNIICVGLLLDIKLHNFNTDNVILKTIYPLSFKEFLIATNNERYINTIEHAYDTNTKLEDGVHHTLMDLYTDFSFLGGMPAVAQNYIDNGYNIMNIDKNISDCIIQKYKIDMAKYARSRGEIIRIDRIFDGIPSQLIRDNKYKDYIKHFLFSGFDDKGKRKVNALDLLITSGIILPEYPLDNCIDKFRIYVSDTGILNNLVNLSPSQIGLIGNTYKETLAKNYIASELVKMGYELFYWSNPDVKSEVCSVICVGTQVIPLVVNDEDLIVFQEKYNPKYCIKVSTNNFDLNNNIKNIPLYAVFCLENNI